MSAAWLALGGRSGSGKSTVCSALPERENLVVSTDAYFRPLDQVPTVGRSGRPNWWSPSSCDLVRAASDVRCLLRGESVSIPTYSKERARVVGSTPVSLSSRLLVVEGLFAPDLAARMDVPQCSALLHLDTPWITCEWRKLQRQGGGLDSCILWTRSAFLELPYSIKYARRVSRLGSTAIPGSAFVKLVAGLSARNRIDGGGE